MSKIVLKKYLLNFFKDISKEININLKNELALHLFVFYKNLTDKNFYPQLTIDRYIYEILVVDFCVANIGQDIEMFYTNKRFDLDIMFFSQSDISKLLSLGFWFDNDYNDGYYTESDALDVDVDVDDLEKFHYKNITL